MFLTDQIHFGCFCRNPPNDHFCHFISNSDQPFQVKIFKVYVIAIRVFTFCQSTCLGFLANKGFKNYLED